MKINLANLTNSDLVSYVNGQIALYEVEKEMNKNNSRPVYDGVSLSDFQVFEKHLQRCRIYGTEGSAETAAKVKQILEIDGRIVERQEKAIPPLHEYFKTVNKFDYSYLGQK